MKVIERTNWKKWARLFDIKASEVSDMLVYIWANKWNELSDN